MGNIGIYSIHATYGSGRMRRKQYLDHNKLPQAELPFETVLGV